MLWAQAHLTELSKKVEIAIEMAEVKTAIVPLAGVNYPTWKVQYKISLMKDGLWGIVDDSETAPAETVVHTPGLSLIKTVPWQLSFYQSIHLCSI